MWLALLPLALWDDLGWLSIMANVIIAYLLVGCATGIRPVACLQGC